MDWYWPESRSTCPATSPRSKGHPRMIREAAELILRVRAAGHLRRRRHPQGPGRRGAARAGRADRHPRGHHADGPRRVPRRPSAVPRHARHARQLHRRHVHAAVRPADRARLPLRRPGHRQGRRVRPRGQDHPRRHRPRRAGQGPPARRADRRRLPAGDRGAGRAIRELLASGADAARPQRVEEPHQRLAGDVPADLRAVRPGDALKPQFVLEQLRDSRPDDTIVASGVGQHQMWAGAVLEVQPPLHVGELGRARHHGLRRARPPSAPRSAGPTAWCGPSTATAASR